MDTPAPGAMSLMAYGHHAQGMQASWHDQNSYLLARLAASAIPALNTHLSPPMCRKSSVTVPCELVRVAEQSFH
jgi:hypothetical protein